MFLFLFPCKSMKRKREWTDSEEHFKRYEHDESPTHPFESQDTQQSVDYGDRFERDFIRKPKIKCNVCNVRLISKTTYIDEDDVDLIHDVANECEGCKLFFCDDHTRQCNDCSYYYCKKCYQVDECPTFDCDSHLCELCQPLASKCPVCDKVYCEDCSDDWLECSCCANGICSDCADNNMYICDAGSHTVCEKCELVPCAQCEESMCEMCISVTHCTRCRTKICDSCADREHSNPFLCNSCQGGPWYCPIIAKFGARVQQNQFYVDCVIMTHNH
jgi:hypothetical protein